MFISQVVALFLKTKGFKTFSHIFQPLHSVFLNHMQNNDRGKSVSKGGKTAARLKSLLTNIVICYLTVGSFGIWRFSQMQECIVYYDLFVY